MNKAVKLFLLLATIAICSIIVAELSENPKIAVTSEKPQNQDFFFFLIVGVGGVTVGYLIGTDRGYKKCIRDINQDRTDTFRERQKKLENL